MEEYYIYNGQLYSTSELEHFKIGWIKPNHKWITRTRSKDGKRWIYTYGKANVNDEKDYAQLSGEEFGRVELYDTKIKEIEDYLQKHSGPRVMSLAQIRDVKNKQNQLAYLKRKRSEHRNKANSYLRKARLNEYKKINDETAKTTKSNSLLSILKKPFLSKAASKEIEEGKKKIYDDIYKKRMTELNDKIASGKKLLLETKTTKKVETNKSASTVKERAPFINVLNKLQNNKNAIYGLNVQKQYISHSEQIKEVNSEGYNSSFKEQYSTNCANCSVTYDLRARGYDVKAQPHVNDAEYYSHDNIREIAKDFYTGDKQMCAMFTEKRKNDEGITYWDPDKRTKEIIKVSSAGKTVPKEYDTWPYKSSGRSLGGKPNSILSLGKTINNKAYVMQIEKDILKGGNGSRGIVDFQWANYNCGHSVSYEVRNNKVIIIDAQSNKEYSISELYDCTWGMEYLRTDNLEPTKKVKSAVENR